MATKHDGQFYKVARVTFADLRRQYQALFPTTTGQEFSALCYEKTDGHPTIMDWLMAASRVVTEAEQDATYYDRMAEEQEAQHLYEAQHFAAERDWI